MSFKTTFNQEELRKCVSPAEIAEYIKELASDFGNKLEAEPHTQSISVDTPSTSQGSSQLSLYSSSQISEAQKDEPNRYSSNEFRAKWMVQNNRVQLLSNLRVFNVSNENDQVCVVKLHPESCSCAEKKGCSHIYLAIDFQNTIENFIIPYIVPIRFMRHPVLN